ncbi:hypothetical protein JCM10213v2_007273 [Rhodosporidiobolus nylandii]
MLQAADKGIVPFASAVRWARILRSQIEDSVEVFDPILRISTTHSHWASEDGALRLFEFDNVYGERALAVSVRQLADLQRKLIEELGVTEQVLLAAWQKAKLFRLPRQAGTPVSFSSADDLKRRVKELADMQTASRAEQAAKAKADRKANPQDLPTPAPSVEPSSAESTPEPVLKKRKRERPAPATAPTPQLPTPAPSAPSTPSAYTSSALPYAASSSGFPFPPTAVSHTAAPATAAPVPSASAPPAPSRSAVLPIPDAKLAGQKQFELAVLRHAYSRAQQEGGGAFVALDVEFWERDHDVLLEFGWSVVEFTKKGSGKVKARREDQHVVVKENAKWRNKRYVADARDHFDFGRTLTLKSTALFHLLSALFSTFSASQPVFLIFHDPRGDLRALDKLGFDSKSEFENDLRKLAVAAADSAGGGGAGNVWIADTQRLFEAWVGRKCQIGLEKACTELQVPTKRLHNAGNDAHYTLDLFERLMDPLRQPSASIISFLDERAAEAARQKEERLVRAREKKEQAELQRQADGEDRA